MIPETTLYRNHDAERTGLLSLFHFPHLRYSLFSRYLEGLPPQIWFFSFPCAIDSLQFCQRDLLLNWNASLGKLQSLADGEITRWIDPLKCMMLWYIFHLNAGDISSRAVSISYRSVFMVAASVACTLKLLKSDATNWYFTKKLLVLTWVINISSINFLKYLILIHLSLQYFVIYYIFDCFLQAHN